MIKSDRVQTVTFKPGEYILREGARCDSLFIVKEGQIEIYRTGNNKQKIPMALVQSGEYLGEMSLVSDRPHNANAVALTSTTCVKITSEVLEEQLKKSPTWLVALTHGLVYRLSRTNDIIKRNGIIDPSLSSAVQAIEDKKRKSA